jgi:uridine phosphorylase
MPARLRPTAPVAPEAILVGDPGRALMLAQALLEQPKMSNHARGLWGYSGRTPAGRELTIQSTGMGGPSAGVVLADLAELGVRRAVRIGTCAALAPDLHPGELIVVTEATHVAFVSQERTNATPDPELTAELEGALGDRGRKGQVASVDVLPAPSGDPGADVTDMQTAALLNRGAELGIAVAAVLIVAETREAGLLDEELEEAAKVAGEAAAAVL